MPKSRVKQLMQEQGYTVRSFAAKVGVTEQTIMKARRDDKILTCRMSTLAKIADALGVGFDDLLSLEKKTASEQEG